MRPNTKTKDAILSRVRKDAVTGCWLWLQYRKPKGYGRWCINGVRCYPHRIAFELWKGPIPLGLKVLHKCDNPPCCNPDHLFLGTNLDNIIDSVKKGRWNNKLTDDQVREIRLDPRSDRIIAPEYGIHHTAVWRLRKGIQYRRVK